MTFSVASKFTKQSSIRQVQYGQVHWRTNFTKAVLCNEW